MHAIMKDKEATVDARNKFVLEVNPDKTKYMLLDRHQNAGKNHYIKITNRCFEYGAQLKYLEATNRFRRKISGDLIRVMFATIQSRTFCLLICCLKT
jgi:hypothetical protein